VLKLRPISELSLEVLFTGLKRTPFPERCYSAPVWLRDRSFWADGETRSAQLDASPSRCFFWSQDVRLCLR